MLRMVVFDFDGVIADCENAHFRAFRKVFLEQGIDLTWEQYCVKYLGLTDYECIAQILADDGRPIYNKKEQIKELFLRKKAEFAHYLNKKDLIMPGVERLLEGLCANNIICSICSGALRCEIDVILRQGGLQDFFEIIISAEDVSHGKPDPEGYRLSIARINENAIIQPRIQPGECVVIEDSIWGIRAGQAAGMRCVALTTTYQAEQLAGAEMIVKDLTCLDIDRLREVLK